MFDPCFICGLLLRQPNLGQIDRADLLVDEVVVVELKAAKMYQPADESQFLNEAKAIGIKIRLLVNFGREKVEFRRMVY